MLPEVRVDGAAYEWRPCGHSGLKRHSNLLRRLQITIDRLRLRFEAARRLRIIVSELGTRESRNISGDPGLIERLEARLASADDLQVREQFLKFLPEP
jgi:hypothetical protein